MSYHVNPKTGNPGSCRARKGNCPFGSEDEHFATREEASQAWQENQEVIAEPVRKIYLSDIDGTLVKKSLVLTSAVNMHREGHMDLGDVPDRWEADMKNETLIRELAEAYREALSGRTVAFVKAEDHIEKLIADPENFHRTLKDCIEAKEAGHEVVLISGSPDFLVEPFANHFGFKWHASTYHKDEEGRFTGEITLMAGAQAKEAVIQDLGIHEYDEVVGLGDTASDAPLLAAAHRSVLVAPTEETMELLRAKNIRIDEIVLD